MKRPGNIHDLAKNERLIRAHLASRVKSLRGPQAEIVLKFIEEILACFDPEVVDDFMEWREDARLTSLLHLAARLSDDMRDQLLFQAEDLFVSEQTRQ